MNLFGVGPTEILVILVVILVLFGPDRLPELAKRIGGASREIRENLDSINEQMSSALDTSMEVDKARMSQPTEASPNVTTVTPEENTIMPELPSGNSILPEHSSEDPIPTERVSEAPASSPPPTETA
jgi:sec-independent protein translocase protein TatA